MVETKQSLSILDLDFFAVKTLNNTVRLLTNVYTKPVGAYQYLHWYSSHPITAKIAIPWGEYIRRSRILHDTTDISLTRKDLTIKLRKRLYPKIVLIHTFHKAQTIIDTKKSDLSHVPLLDKIKDKRRTPRFPWNEQEDISSIGQATNKEIIWPIIINYKNNYTSNIQHLKTILNDRITAYNEQLAIHYNIPIPYKIKTIVAYKRNKKLINILNNT